MSPGDSRFIGKCPCGRTIAVNSVGACAQHHHMLPARLCCGGNVQGATQYGLEITPTKAIASYRARKLSSRKQTDRPIIGAPLPNQLEASDQLPDSFCYWLLYKVSGNLDLAAQLTRLCCSSFHSSHVVE